MAGEPRKKSSLTNQSIWILFAKVVGFALNTMLPLLIVRYLSQENVGVYRQVFLVASNAVLVLPLGFSMSAYYFLNRDPEKQPAAVLNILLFNFAMGAGAFVLLVFFPQALGSAFQSPELTRLAPLIGVLIWLWIFSGFLETAALALQEARLAAGFIVLSQLFKTGLMIAAVLYFHTVDSLIYATILLFGVQAFVLVGYLNRKFPGFWRRFDWPFFREQMAYALPFGLSVLLYVGQTDLHNYFVSHSFSPADFAIYSVGCFQLPLIAMLYESVGAVMIPRMSQMQDEDKRREMLHLTVNATQKLAFFYFPLFAYLMIVAGEFITTLFTKDYSASVGIFRVNLLALPLFSLVVDPVTRAFPTAGRFLLKVRVFICVALIAVFWLGLGRFDLIEMITIVVAAILFEKLVCAWISAKMLEAKMGDFKLLAPTGKIALASLFAAGVVFAVHALAGEVLLSGAISISAMGLSAVGFHKGAELIGGGLFLALFMSAYAAIYLPAAFQMGAVADDDREKFLRFFRKLTHGRPTAAKTA